MRFAVIGNPIDKSLSPQLHEILYKKLDILNCSFEKIHIENDKLDNFFNSDSESIILRTDKKWPKSTFNQRIVPTNLYSLESPEGELSNDYRFVGAIR